jgi:hypothetical protein
MNRLTLDVGLTDQVKDGIETVTLSSVLFNITSPYDRSPLSNKTLPNSRVVSLHREYEEYARKLPFLPVSEFVNLEASLFNIGKGLKKLLSSSTIKALKENEFDILDIYIEDRYGLPWELLTIKGKFLSLCGVVSRVPIPPPRSQPSSTIPNVLIIQGYSELYFSGFLEAKAIANEYKKFFGRDCKLLSSPTLDSQEVMECIVGRNGLCQYDIIHFVGHSAVEDNYAYIFLSKDKILTSDEVEDFGNLYNAPIIFLNSCSSSSYPSTRHINGQRVTESFAQKFISIGAYNFLGVLFPIRDDLAYHFARAFYRSLFSHVPIGWATLEARKKCQANIASIAYVLYGDPSRKIGE